MIDLSNYTPIDFPWDFTCFSKIDKNPLDIQLPLCIISVNTCTPDSNAYRIMLVGIMSFIVVYYRINL